jgi:hypothetical protein
MGIHFVFVLLWTFRFRFLRRVPPCGGAGTFGGTFTFTAAGATAGTGTGGTGGMARGDFTSVTNTPPRLLQTYGVS